jgi:hypothetical protein
MIYSKGAWMTSNPCKLDSDAITMIEVAASDGPVAVSTRTCAGREASWRRPPLSRRQQHPWGRTRMRRRFSTAKRGADFRSGCARRRTTQPRSGRSCPNVCRKFPSPQSPWGDLGRFQALRVPPNPRWVVAQSLQRLCASQKVSESVTEPDDRWPIVQILDGKDARWCPSCGYSLRTCILRAMNSDPQGERCCDECDHPPWERSERPLLDHPVETEPDLGAGWGPGDLHMTTNPNDPINFHWP